MDEKILIIKCIILLYKETILKDNNHSKDIVRTVIDSIKQPELAFGLAGDKEITNNLRNVALQLLNDTDYELDKEDLLQTLRICTLSNDKLFKIIEEGICRDEDEKSLKRSVITIRKMISNYLKELKIADILNKASYAFKFQKDKITDTSQFINEIISQLEPLQLTQNANDPAIVDDIDIGNDESIMKVFSEVKNRMVGSGVYKTGWTDLNDMLQGGFRPGEFVMIPALQHKYKTGFTLSLFAQIATNNAPLTKDISKKPLLLRISFEDDINLNLQFLYQYLKYNETRQPVNHSDVTVVDMAKYVKERLQVNGFNIKMLRVDPTQWSYKNICNKILEYETQGYNVEVVMVDYLTMLPTTGCINTGPVGSDKRDLYRRLRNFMSSKSITFITPTQVSTEGKNLIRGGMPEGDFVKEIAEKGYFADCKQLDQEVDLELYIHLVKQHKETYLTVQRGKHRVPTILSDEEKYFVLKFPKGMPIPEDLNEPDRVPMRKIPSRAVTNASDDLFKM